jgi:hypothetical protein
LRSDRVYLSDIVDQAALKDEFDYFGIDADMSKVCARNDFGTIADLNGKIKKYEGMINNQKTKIAAIKESYRLASEFTSCSDAQGLYLKQKVGMDIDTELLRECLLSRGLHVVCYDTDEPVLTANICSAAMKHKYVKKA